MLRFPSAGEIFHREIKRKEGEEEQKKRQTKSTESHRRLSVYGSHLWCFSFFPEGRFTPREGGGGVEQGGGRSRRLIPPLLASVLNFHMLAPLERLGK